MAHGKGLGEQSPPPRQRPRSIYPVPSGEGFLVVILTYSKWTAERVDLDHTHYICPDMIYELADHSSIAPAFR